MEQFGKYMGYSLIFFGFLFSSKVFCNSPELDPIFYEASSEVLKSKLIDRQNSLDDWVQNLEATRPEFICLGETHEDRFRQFYADQFFSKYSIDVLYMEGTQLEINEMVKKVLLGDTGLKFLGAIISPVIKAALELNPDIKFVGVELTKEQKKAVTLNRGIMSREGFIAQNVLQNFSKDRKNVMLYGSNHCAQYDIGLGQKTPAYKHIQKVLHKDNTRSVKLVFHHISEYLTASLSGVYLPGETVVFRDTTKLPPSTYNYIWKLKENFINFDDLIYAY